MNTKTTNSDRLTLGLLVRKNGQSKLMMRKPIAHSDLRAARDETWWQAVRSGVLPEDLAALHMEVLPGENLNADWVDGFSVHLSDGKRSFIRHFPNSFFSSTAMMLKRDLIKREVITKHDTCFYFLSAIPAEAAAREEEKLLVPPEAGPEVPVIPELKVRVRPNPVPLGKASLAEYQKASEPMPGNPEPDLDHGTDTVEPMPIFITRDAWRQSHELARRGGKKESAGILVGRLMRDEASPELFMVVEACLEAEEASEHDYSVTFSGETWSRIHRILEQRRHRLHRPNEIILGSVHGHNFMVGENSQGRSECDTCDQRHACSQTTAFASPSDMEWHQIHFTGQPWAVLLVWGWNVRGNEEWRLHGLSGAVLAPRGLEQLKSEISETQEPGENR